MSNDDLTKILLDKMEAILIRTNELADNLNKVIGRLESKEIQCSGHLASLVKCQERIDFLEKEVNQITGVRMMLAWLFTTCIALWGVVKDHVK